MSPDSTQQEPVQDLAIQDLGDAEVHDEVQVQEPVQESTETTPELSPVGNTDGAVETPLQSVEAPLPDLDPEPEPVQTDIQELQRLRQANQIKEWEQEQLKKAQAIQQEMLQRGADPESAKMVGRQYIKHEQEKRDQENKFLDALGNAEGRNNAAIHFAQKYNLIPKQAVEDVRALLQGRTPAEMDREARRIAESRATKAELQKLKQGRVTPQTFDNSQGSAEATSNNRLDLIKRYNAGDRSPEARAAVESIGS